MDLHHSSLNIFIQFQMFFSYTNDWPLGVKHWSRAMAMVGFIPLVRCSMALWCIQLNVALHHLVEGWLYPLIWRRNLSHLIKKSPNFCSLRRESIWAAQRDAPVVSGGYIAYLDGWRSMNRYLTYLTHPHFWTCPNVQKSNWQFFFGMVPHRFWGVHKRTIFWGSQGNSSGQVHNWHLREGEQWALAE